MRRSQGDGRWIARRPCGYGADSAEPVPLADGGGGGGGGVYSACSQRVFFASQAKDRRLQFVFSASISRTQTTLNQIFKLEKIVNCRSQTHADVAFNDLIVAAFNDCKMLSLKATSET